MPIIGIPIVTCVEPKKIQKKKKSRRCEDSSLASLAPQGRSPVSRSEPRLRLARQAQHPSCMVNLAFIPVQTILYILQILVRF